MTPPHLADPRPRRSASPEPILPPQASRTLERAEGLVERGRHRDALLCTGRLRPGRALVGEPAARWRVVRARALWALGSVARARAEAARALQQASSGRTRARARGVLAELAWRGGDVEGALLGLEEAEARSSSQHDPELARLCGRILRDAGRLEEAVSALDRALEAAAQAGDADSEAPLRSDRAGLLGALGRWPEARADVERSAHLFRERGDPRELSMAGVVRAVLDLSQGDLGSARVALERARAMRAGRLEAPRALAEVLLLLSDVYLLDAEAARAEECAREALELFTALRERRGECRGRLRHAHALLALGRRDEALRQARRAVRDTSGSGLAVEAWAQLLLGRLLLHQERAAAGRAFAEALRLPSGRRDLHYAALLGKALARGAGPADTDVRGALDGLGRFGARPMLSHCLAAVRELSGWQAPAPGSAAAERPVGVTVSSEARALVDAARALAGRGAFDARWAGALRAVAGELPWWRTALVAEPGLELRRDLEAPRPLAAADPARRLVAGARGPGLFALDSRPELSEDPIRVLHGLRAAAIAPVAAGSFVYADFRELPRPERAMAFLGELARLLAPHLEEGWGGSSEEAAAPPRLPGIVGRCAAMRTLCADVLRLADATAGVHLEGETGTGKERVARALHEASRRRAGPFVAVNASSLNDELFESELFGHVRGAFSGAVANRDGHVAEAHGGTLFLDEVADLSPRGQAKLLRFVQDREYRRVGESTLRRADVRILTAANVSLAERVAAGLFRQDLMYRLTALSLRLPPLRERAADIPLLARHFLETSARREGRPPLRLSAEVTRRLVVYDWPGNVRELEQEMTRLTYFTAGDVARVEDLSPRLQGSSATRPRVSLREALLAHERQLLQGALDENGGNRARSAVWLGITRQALLLKMRRLGIG